MEPGTGTDVNGLKFCRADLPVLAAAGGESGGVPRARRRRATSASALTSARRQLHRLHQLPVVIPWRVDVPADGHVSSVPSAGGCDLPPWATRRLTAQIQEDVMRRRGPGIRHAVAHKVGSSTGPEPITSPTPRSLYSPVPPPPLWRPARAVPSGPPADIDLATPPADVQQWF